VGKGDLDAERQREQDISTASKCINFGIDKVIKRLRSLRNPA